MKSKISIIIFTHKRAMQLDALINSIQKNFGNLCKPIHIIYDYSKDHHKSYLLLKKKWGKNIVLYKRKNQNLNLKLLFRLYNLIWFLRWKNLRKNYDNFKTLIEYILDKKIKSSFVTMMTDDCILFDKLDIPNEILNIIKKYPNEYTYKFYLNKNFKLKEKKPKDTTFKILKIKNKKFYIWKLKNNLFKKYNYFWNYRFTVDATIYEKKTLLNFLRPIIYNNPTILESNGNKESYLKGFFKLSISNLKRCYGSLHLSNLQNIIDTPQGNYDTEILKKIYLEGYRLKIEKKMFKKFYHILIPKEIYFQKLTSKHIKTYTYLKKNLIYKK